MLSYSISSTPLGEKNCGSEKNRQTKNGGVEGGSWGEREFYKEVGEGTIGVEGRRGRPKLRWEDCVKRDLVGVGGEWRMRAKDRGEWRRLVEMVVKQD